MIRTVYHFDDLGRKVPVGSYDDGYNPVGGRIFYINSNSDETVKFYDSNFQKIANVAVGDSPAYYQITDEGTSGEDKYYVYHGTSYVGVPWTYSNTIELLGTTNGIGTGKNNTTLVMTVNEGAYVSGLQQSKHTIWYYINDMRNNLEGGCSDWFIGSESELSKLISFFKDYASTLGIEDMSLDANVYSSTESGAEYARAYYGTFNNKWTGHQKTSIGTSGRTRVVHIPIRSF